VCSVQYGCFCGSLISCIPNVLLRYFLNDFKIILIAPVITGVTFFLKFHTHPVIIIIIIIINVMDK
jgi:hypothetical protein